MGKVSGHAAHVDRYGNVDTGRYDINVRNNFRGTFAEVRDERTGRVVDRIFAGQSKQLLNGKTVSFDANRCGQEITVEDEYGHIDEFSRSSRSGDHWDRDHIRSGRDCGPQRPDRDGSDCRAERPGPQRPDRDGSDCRAERPDRGNCNGWDKGFDVNERNNTVDTGRYLISASGKDDGTLTIYDKYTNEYMTVSGDPHLKTSDGDEANFNETVTVDLADGVQVTINTTGGENSYLQQATITTKDGQAAAIYFDGDHNPRTEELHGAAARSADWRTPDGGILHAVGGNPAKLTFGRGGPELKGDEGNIDDEIVLSQRHQRQFSPYRGSCSTPHER